MTKILATGLFLIAILISATMLYSVSMIDTNSKYLQLQTYAARKEDLNQNQDTLQNLLLEYNKTLQMELANQIILEQKVTEVSKKADLPPPTINKTIPLEVAAPLTPATPTTPMPRTRAS